MGEIKNFKGQVFFQKDDFKNSYSATLTIENDIFSVEIDGEYYNVGDFQDIIQGEFQELGFVSLIDCYISGSSLGSINTFKFKIQNIVSEVRFNSKEDLMFSSLSIEMPILKKWLKKTSLKGDIVLQNKIEYLGTQKFDLFQNDDYEISVSLFCKESFNQTNIIIEEYAELKISAKKCQLSLFSFLDIYKKTKLLISFLGNHHSGTDSFYLKQDKIIYKNQDSPLTLRLYSTSLSLINNFNFDFVFSYDDLVDDYQEIFSSWFENDKMQESINLLIQKNFLKLSPENYFLNTSFSLETLHRKHFKNNVYEIAEFEEIKKGIIEKLSPAEEKLFIDKLQYANEPSLRTRLKHFKDDFSLVLKGDYKVNKLIGKIVETRNYLVHRGDKNEILEINQMPAIAKVLENIVKLNIFRLIGVNENKIQSKIKPINYDDIFTPTVS